MAKQSETSIISLPKGGGALKGIGETFAPDLHTGTGNFTVPITLPPGRNGFQPQLSLVYSTGNGNGPFGLGWNLNVPGVSRKTAKGIPRYDDATDVFVLSGAEDLIPVAGEEPGTVAYRPRTEGLFAHIVHHRDPANDYWEVRTKDGLRSLYGLPGVSGADNAIIADPNLSSAGARVFAWKLTRTEDLFGNRIEYEYERDAGEVGPHHWDQLYLRRIRYVDYSDVATGEPGFLVSVSFDYGAPDVERPDPFSDYRAGFEIRTRRRCRRIEIRTHAGEERLVRCYHLVYLDERADLPDPARQRLINGASLLSQIRVIGFDGDASEELPPLEFTYAPFAPEGRNFVTLAGADLPARSLASQDVALVDLFGNGLPSMLEMNGSVHYWRNRGHGRFDIPRPMSDAPAGLSLAEPGVQLIDADGDGRTDLLVNTERLNGYFPLRFGGLWDRRSFQRQRQAPSFDLEDPEVRLLDLDGDGVTDAIRSGTRLECFFNDPQEGWNRTRFVERRTLADFPNVSFADPHVKFADMTGDGVQDIILVHDGRVEYWPNLGYGDWGRRITMRNSPHLPFGYDPRRLLIGDVDGDGAADLVYVDDRRVTLWINQSGNSWSDPITIHGTPPVSDADAVQLVDLFGSGIGGILWSTERTLAGSANYHFLDFTGSLKPYLLTEMNNHMGAVTRVEYRPSTHYYCEDERRPATRWKTPLPFPVQVVARVEVIDELSGGKLTTEYSYHHGYWDGADREFRGFGRVDQRDTETFNAYQSIGLYPERSFAAVEPRFFSPPTETRTWFHQGPIGDEFGDWEETDFSSEFWPEDPPGFSRPPAMTAFLRTLPRRARRDALRTLRGSVLRTELYALDGSGREGRPYTVTENLYGVREEAPPGPDESERGRIFFPHVLAQRTTQWERGDDPLTQISFTEGYDAFGQPTQQTSVALPRRSDRRGAADETKILATHTRTDYATPAADLCIHDRVAQVRAFELRYPPDVIETDPQDLTRVLADQINAALQVRRQFQSLIDPWQPGQPLPSDVRLFSHTVNHYDGAAYVGRAAGEVGPYGVLVCSETLAFTDRELDDAYRDLRPVYLEGPSPLPPGVPADFGNQIGYRREQDSPVGYHAGYYFDAQRQKFDFQDFAVPESRGLVIGVQDALGHESAIRPDAYWLLPVEATDPAGLVTTARYDYRVMQPAEVIDPNGNRAAFTFSPLGLLTATWVMGKPENEEGDRSRPSVRMAYDFLAFVNSPPGARQPVCVRTLRHEHHDTETDVPQPERDETLEVVEYSDGFGRLLQTRAQAEDVLFDDPALAYPVFGTAGLPADQSARVAEPAIGRARNPAGPPNVVVSGWQTYDNKGRVVEKYEPFFSRGWDYAVPEDRELGRKVTMVYDPRGQVVRTLNPNESEQRVIFGVPEDVARPEHYAPTPWESYTYDANDNAGRTHPDPVEGGRYRHHWNTPASARIDALGRTLETVERNGDPPTAGQPLPLMAEYRTRSTYDIQGNLLTVTDALGRVTFRHAYDLAKRPLRVDSIDAGLRLTVVDALGNPVEQRDSKGAIRLHTYDALNRPIRLWARDDGSGPLTLRERLDYGDGGNPNQSVIERDAARAANRLGRLHRHHDEAGLLTFAAYDFKGNVLEKSRRVISDAQILAGFGDTEAGEISVYRVDWQPPGGTPVEAHAETILEPEAYETSLTYDALNRVKTMRYPRDVDGERKLLQPRYNRAGALEEVRLDDAVYVAHIAYNAKGQRLLIVYGNGVMTRYGYDPDTFRLVRLRSERFTLSDAHVYHPSGGLLQDFAYDYDLVGNILTIRERVPGCGISPQPDELDRRFIYDALYRLRSATGREHDQPLTEHPWNDILYPPDITRVRPYTETYDYDPLGNIIQWRHGVPNGGFVRSFTLVEGNNRLARLEVAGMSFDYLYDANGNMTQETTSRHFGWDHADRMKAFRCQPEGSAQASTNCAYLYDAAGQRVKKLVRHQRGTYETTAYIDGIFERHSIGGNGRVQQNNTLHVMDDRQRIAEIRVGAAFPGDGAPEIAVRYHLGDHLGSSNVMVGGRLPFDGGFVNREEFLPYGETSFGGFARKRYRFTGKERDKESGLNYHAARYYVPWSGRWASTDPLLGGDGPNLYVFTRCNSMAKIDPSGNNADAPPLSFEDVRGIADQVKKEIIERAQEIIPSGHDLDHLISVKKLYEDYRKHLSREDWRKLFSATPELYAPLSAGLNRSKGWQSFLEYFGTNNPSIGGLTELLGARAQEMTSEARDAFARNVSQLKARPEWVKPNLEGIVAQLKSRTLTVTPHTITQLGGTPSDTSAIRRRGSGALKEGAENTLKHQALKLARKSLLHGIVIVGAYFQAEDIAEAAENERYVEASILFVGVFADPVDWGMSAYYFKRAELMKSKEEREIDVLLYNGLHW